MAYTRDSQRSRLYAAESVIYGKYKSKWAVKYSQYDLNSNTPIVFCQRYVDLILSQKFITKRYGQRRIAVKSGRGGAMAIGGSIISLGRWARDESVVLHEIAHCLTPFSKHGPEFAGVYLFLVRNVLGNEAATELRQSYRTNRVRYNNNHIPVIKKEIKKMVVRPNISFYY